MSIRPSVCLSVCARLFFTVGLRLRFKCVCACASVGERF